MMYQSYIKLPLTSYNIAIDYVMFVSCYHLNPETSLACQTMASPICQYRYAYTCILVVSETATHTTLQQSKVYQARLLPCKINLTSSQEFDGRAGEPGDKAS